MEPLPAGHIARMRMPPDIADKLGSLLPEAADQYVALVMPVSHGESVVETYRQEPCSVLSCQQLCWISNISKIGLRICYDCLASVWPEWRSLIVDSILDELENIPHQRYSEMDN